MKAGYNERMQSNGHRFFAIIETPFSKSPFMKIYPLILLLVAIVQSASLAQEPTENEQQDKAQSKLNVQIEEVETSLVDLNGFVKSRSKYSFEIDTGTTIHTVKLAKDASIKLKVTSPRIDLEKEQLIIDVAGAEKRFRAYSIPIPLFVKIDFVHQKQIKRVAAQPIKRIADFELMATKTQLPANGLSWIGEIKKGDSNRNLKLKLKENEYDVLLGKRGSMSGFAITDLKAGTTGVRISGRLSDDGVVKAREILFWPAAGYKKTAASN